MGPPTLVDSVEIHHVGSLEENKNYSSSSSSRSSVVGLSGGWCVAGETMRAPSPWLDSRTLSRVRPHSGWIDPASIAIAPEYWRLVWNLDRPTTTHENDASTLLFVANPRLVYPNATPTEWRRAMPVSEISTMATIQSVMTRHADCNVATTSKRRVTANPDDTAKPTSEGVKESACALKVVCGSARKGPRTDKWQGKFELLRSFQRENGHFRVPMSFIVDSVKLGKWVATQRTCYQKYMAGKSSPITEERIAQLNSIGFVWRAKISRADHEKWQRNLQLLCAFQREQGHCRVPHNYIVNSVKLGHWLSNQRTFYRNYMVGKGSPITKERIAQLNATGFEWRVKGVCDTWQRKYELLCAFQREHGHCRVSQSLMVGSVSLGHWVKNQRDRYQNYMKGKGSRITEGRIAQLNAIGFTWRAKKSIAEIENFGAARSKKRVAGDLNDTSVKPSSKRRKETAAAVKVTSPMEQQRCQNQNCMVGTGTTITEERIAVINSMGFKGRLKAPLSVISPDAAKNVNKSAQQERHIPIPGLPHSLDDPLLRLSLDSNGMQHCKRPDGWIGEYSPDRRRLRIEHFLVKRSQRVWTKTILNNVRKDSADKRRRVEGRFVKNESMGIRKSIPKTTSAKITNRPGGITINKPRGRPKTGTSRKGGLAASLEADEKRREKEDKKRERQEKKVKKQQEKKAAAVASSSSAMDEDDRSAAQQQQQQQQQQHIPGSGLPFSLDDPLLRFFVDAKGLQQCERPDGWIGAYSPDSRRVRLERFLVKRLQRVWTNTVIYDVRKNFADGRLRVKGRFVKKEDELMMLELISLT